MDRALFSSSISEWETPPWLFAKLESLFGEFGLDAAASEANSKTKRYFTVQQDALCHMWKGKGKPIFLNPPYGRRVGDWVRHAWEMAHHGETVVALLAARTETKWFHDWCKDGSVYLLKGRLKFYLGGNECSDSAPFPSAVVVLGPGRTRKIELVDWR